MLSNTDWAAGEDEYPAMVHPQTPGLIMHWVGVSTDPAAHARIGATIIAVDLPIHRDQLQALWIKPETASTNVMS